MNEIKLLKKLVIYEWIIILLAALLSAVETGLLPSLLQEYLDKQRGPNSSPMGTGVGTILFVLVFVHILACIGVYRLRPWGKLFYLLSTFFFLVIQPFLGPIILGPLSGIFDGLGWICTGVIIGLLCFSPAKDKFVINAS